MLSECSVKIQLKKSTGLGLKSMAIDVLNIITNDYTFSDSILSEMTLGPEYIGSGFQHWNEITEKPEERIFLWHDAVSFQ